MVKLKLGIVLFLIIFHNSLSGQEICNNDIDDDGNGLIDSQDPACASCYELFFDEIEEDFEDYSCCPSQLSDTDCIDGGWVAVTGTPDYFHTCGFLSSFLYTVPLPIPSGEGCIGFSGSESMGFCLDVGLVPSETYDISFHVGFNDEGLFPSSLETEITLYGSAECSSLTGVDFLCIDLYWFEIATFTITSATQDNWVYFSGDFTPTTEVNALAIVHNDCLNQYIGHFIDGFKISGNVGTLQSDVPEVALWGNCMDGYYLEATAAGSASSYQWYLDGEPIIGANGNIYQIETSQSGQYEVSVLDNLGCHLISEPFFADIELSDLNVMASYQDLVCDTTDNTNIALSIDGGVTPYSYFWEDGSVYDTLFDAGIGFHSVTITDGDGCTADFSFLVDTFPSMNLSFATTLAGCNGELEGSIDLTVSGGQSPYMYQWSNDSISENLIELGEGTYAVTVTDINSCTTIDSVFVDSNSSIEISTTLSNINCNDSDDGFIFLDIVGDSSEYDIIWNTASDSNYIFDLSVGSYSVTVTSDNGCTWDQTYDLYQNSDLTITATVVDNSCFQGQEGSIDIEIENSNSPYSILWSNGHTGEDLSNISVGQYEFSLIDSFGCVYNNTYDVEQGLDIVYSTSQIEPGCNGASDGSINILPISGTLPFSYLWSTGDTDSQLSNIQAGVYYVTITDNVGCTDLDTFSLSENSILEVDESIIHNTCHGDSQGQVSIDISGSIGPYEVLWSNASTLPSITALAAGIYEVTITDAIGCEINRIYTVTQPDSLGIIENIELPLCHDDQGLISIEGFGGMESYSILWSTGVTSSTIDIEPGNNYEVTLTDENNCTASLDFSIDQILEVDIEVISVTDTGPSNNTGEITIDITGGSLPYQIIWNDGQTGTTAIELGYGDYIVDVIDANGCVAQLTINIGYPSLTQQSSMIHNLCFGDCSGSIDLDVDGGILPYSFIWSDGQTSMSATNLCVGTYQATIVDATGSEISTEQFVIQGPTQINIAGLVFDISCVGIADGQIEVDASGGVEPFSYSWNNGMVGKDINNLSPGSYQVTVVDENDCIDSSDFTLLDIPQVDFELDIKDFDCDEVLTSIEVIGDNTYNYPIYINDSKAIIDEGGFIRNLAEGSYTISYQINDLCMVDIQEIEIINPNKTQIELNVDSAFLKYEEVLELTLNIESELPQTGFTIDWEVINSYECTNTFQEGQCESIAITAIEDEVLIVTFTDDRGCISVLTAEIKVDNTVHVNIPNIFSPNGDGINDIFEVISNRSDIFVDRFIIFDRWGNNIYSQQKVLLPDLIPWVGVFKNKEVADGVYVYILELTTKDGDPIIRVGDITLIR